MVNQNASLVEAFVTALQDDRLCLHPTDGLPGLGYNPNKILGFEALLRFKQRPLSQAVLALAATPEAAFQFWKPLPSPWEVILKNLWPAPLTVIWESSQRGWKGLVGEDGTLALRVPHFNPETVWMKDLLVRLTYPLPSTSVNISGQPPCTRFQEAAALVAEVPQVFIPTWTPSPANSGIPKPSTLIRISSDASFQILRQGLVSQEDIQKVKRSFI